jgi:hypothetical protein
MKTTKTIIVFIVAYMLIYLLLSSIGCIFFNKDLQHYSYSECIGNTMWFMMYNLFIGWWVAGIVANDYYETINKH